ncbi:MAG: EAL domain-containing protein [Prochloraceae cyanobacterium]|nr:EAL domain-containing protein [Prochloraceae cyanobacterium]
MKIAQKLTVGFLGTFLLIGGLGLVFIKLNSQIRSQTEQVVKGISEEAILATNISRSLQSIQVDSQAILNSNITTNSGQQNRRKYEQKIKEELSNLGIKLEAAKNAIESPAKTIDSSQENREKKKKQLLQEDKQFKILYELIQEYEIYRGEINGLLIISARNIEEARKFYNKQISDRLLNRIIPLVEKYQESSIEEIKESEIYVNRILQETIDIIQIYALCSLAISLALLIYIYRSICAPIKKLQEATFRAGIGLSENLKVETKNRKDEFGVLADRFNFTIEELKQTTVSMSYLDKILDSMAESLIVASPNKTIEKVNQATKQLLGYSQEELIGKKLDVILGENPQLDTDNLIKTDRDREGCEIIYLTKDEKKIPVAFSSSTILNERGHIQGIVWVARDITEQHRAEKALRESEQRYALAARAVNDGLWDWDVKADLFYFSPRWKSMLGYEEEEIGNSLNEWLKIVHSNDRDPLQQKLKYHLKSEDSQWEITYQILHKDGNYRWMLCRAIALRDDRGRVYRMTGAQTDITKRKLTEKKLRYEALHDKLTGLANRTFFLQRLKQIINLAQQNKNYLFAVMFLDIDRFRTIEDSMGHLVADKLLIEIANRLKEYLLGGNTIARLGGDEFGIILEKIKYVSDAAVIAEKTLDLLVSPFEIEGRQISISASIGIAVNTTYYEKVEDLLRDTDTALCRAKASSKIGGSYAVFESSMQLEALNRLELENELRQAMERWEFQLYYQPIMELSSNKISGFETLVRWQHPQKGIVSPAEFISVAQETGLIASLSWSVMTQACRQMRHWQEQYNTNPPLYVSVNISAIEFCQTDFVEGVTQILLETGLQPHNLQLEINESSIIENIERTKLILGQLKNLGVRVSMDDFGTGYSSLSHISSLPIDTLKIDSSFFKNIDIDRERYEVVRSIVNLSFALGIDPIAEGVEKTQELAKLQELDCKYAQGYLFSKPVTHERAEALIAQKYSS